MADFTVEGIIDIDAASALRSLTRLDSKLKGTLTQLKAVDKAVKALDGREIDITVDVDDKATDKLDKIGNSFFDLKDVTADLNLGELDTSGIGDVEVDIDVDRGGLAELESLQQEMESITDDVTIGVSMDADRAIAKAMKLNREIDAALQDQEVHVDVDRSAIDKFHEVVKATTFSLGSPGRGGLIGGVALLATTLAPLSTVATGVAGGMVASFATMGASVGAFGLLAAPTISKVIEGVKLLQTETSELSGEQLAEYNKQMRELKNQNPALYEAAKAVNRLVERYKELAEQMQPIVLGAMTQAVGAATVALNGMAPAAFEAGRGIRTLMKEAKEGLKGDDWQNFFSYMEENARGFTEIWGRTIGNFITGIANMIVAFHPLTTMVNEGFLGMSESFLKWSQGLEENQGFQNFVAYVEEWGPKVWDTLGDLFGLLIDIGVALAPVGEAVLNAISNFANWYEEQQRLNPELVNTVTQIGFLVAVLAPFAGTISGIIGPIGKLFGEVFKLGGKSGLGALAAKFPKLGPAIGVVGGPVGILIGLLASLGIGLALTTDTGEKSKNMWESFGDLWDKVKEAGKGVWQVLKDLWEVLKESGAIENFQAALTDLAAGLEPLLPLLKPIALIIGGTLLAAIWALSWAIRGIAKAMRVMNEMIGLILKPFIAAWEWVYDKLLGHSIIPDIVNGIKKWFGRLPGIAGRLFGQMKDRIVNSIKGLVDNVMKGMTSVKNSVQNKLSQAKNAAVQLAGNLKEGAVNKFEQLRSATASKFNSIKESASSKFSAAKTAVTNKATEMKTAAVSKMAELVNGMSNKLSGAKSAVTNAFSGASSWLYDKGKQISEGIASGIRAGVSAIDSAMDWAASVAGKYWPGSPVKAGPLMKFNDGSPGRELMEMVAWGIRHDNSLDKAMGQLTADLAPRFSFDDWGSIDRKPLDNAGAPSGSSGGGGRTYNIEVKAPVGSSSADIGKTIVKHIDEFEKAGGRKRS